MSSEARAQLDQNHRQILFLDNTIIQIQTVEGLGKSGTNTFPTMGVIVTTSTTTTGT